MKARFHALFLVPFIAASCGGETADENMDADAAAEAAAPAETMSADEAAIDQIRNDYVTHYNLHHASMVADLYADSATLLAADGAILESKDAILANLEEAMAASPTLSLEGRETMIFGDFATAIGSYSVDMTQEGQAMTMAGNYLSGFERQADGTWKLIGVITNFNAPAPEDMVWAESDGEEPPENGTMTDLITAYETHFNLGHADMVADLYTDDAKVAFANLPYGEGRAAVVSALENRFAMGDNPQIDIHDVYTMQLDGGYAIDAGWYSITAGDNGMNGTYISLAQQQADGSWKLHWMVSNGHPATD